MSRAIADPEEIRVFVHLLLENVNRVRALQANTRSRFNDLHDHWQDEKYARFRELFTDTMRSLDQFLQHGETYADYLTRKAELLRRYLEHRY